MNPEMSSEVLKALEKAVLKYDSIAQGVGVNMGSMDCALCQMFPRTCEGCPVADFAGARQCHNTPYYEMIQLLRLGITLPAGLEWWKYEYRESSYEDPFAVVEGVEQELIFLLGLLPNNHPWRDQI